MANLLVIEAQEVLDKLANLLICSNEGLCHPVLTVLQVQGSLILLFLGAGWLLTGLRRSEELQNRKSSFQARASKDLRTCKGWPGVTVILPLKGCRAFSIKNWESQLNQTYARYQVRTAVPLSEQYCISPFTQISPFGPLRAWLNRWPCKSANGTDKCTEGRLEAIFVVDSLDDPAYKMATLLAKNGEGISSQVIVASHSKTCSQKIQNLQSGIQAASIQSRYVLCVDDDVCLHPNSLQDSISALEASHGTFMATGYPFDVPGPSSNLLTYAALSYHLPLLIGFSLCEKTPFVWGGFMLFPLQDMLSDRYGIMKAWTDGGYSDDLIVAAKCGEQNLSILCPTFAVFPQRLDTEYSWAQYWNYLRRQVYVMDTYSSPLNRRVNHTMMFLHSYLSLAFTVPATTVAIRLLLWILEIIMLPTQKIYSGPGTSLQWAKYFGIHGCPWSSASTILFGVSLSCAAASLLWMSGVVLDLFKVLSADRQHFALANFHWGKLWLGFYLNNLLIPWCMFYTCLTESVIWSGVEYTRRRGKVVRTRRLNEGVHAAKQRLSRSRSTSVPELLEHSDSTYSQGR